MKQGVECDSSFLQCVCMYRWGKSLENMHQYSTCKQWLSLLIFIVFLKLVSFFQIWKTNVYYFYSEKKLDISIWGEKNQFGRVNFIPVWLIGCFVTGMSNPKLIPLGYLISSDAELRAMRHSHSGWAYSVKWLP